MLPRLSLTNDLKQHTACEQLSQDATKGPYVNLLVVGQTQNDFRSSVAA